MTLQKANGPGWGAFEKLTSAQMNFVQGEYIKAVDGTDGGTFSPSPRITLGGDGLHMTALLECEGNVIIDTVGHSNSLTVGGAADIADLTVSGAGIDVTTGVLHVGGLAQIDGDLFVGDDLSVTGDSTFLGAIGGADATFGGTVLHNGPATFATGQVVTFHEAFLVDSGKVSDWGSGAVQISSSGILAAVGTASTIDGTTSFTGAITLASTATVALASVITPSGVGRVVQRVVVGADANSTYGPQDADVVRIPALGATRTYTVGTSGAVDGDRMRFTGFDNSTVNPAMVNGYGVANTAGGAYYLFVDFVFQSGAWHAEAWYLIP